MAKQDIPTFLSLVTFMFKTLGKFAAVLALSCGVMSAQAENLGLLTEDQPIFDTLPNQAGLFESDFVFKLDKGLAATFSGLTFGKALTFEGATLLQKVGGSWLTLGTDNDSADGLFDLGAAKNLASNNALTFKVTFEFASLAGFTKSNRSFGALINVGSAVSPVPEPESYAMFLAGLGILGAIARRRKQA